MHFWNNQSVVSKETFSWRCINFSDFSHFLERVFRLQFTKNWSKSHSWTCFLLLLMAGVQETFHHSHESFCHSSFWELSSEKVFQKGQKSLKSVHCWKLLLWKQDSGDLKRTLNDFRSLFYQMDHIWWAPSMLKESLLLLFWEQ